MIGRSVDGVADVYVRFREVNHAGWADRNRRVTDGQPRLLFDRFGPNAAVGRIPTKPPLPNEAAIRDPCQLMFCSHPAPPDTQFIPYTPGCGNATGYRRLAR